MGGESSVSRERDLSRLFSPDRVAVVGATPREGSVARAIVENLAAFEGSVVGVNPNYDEVCGVECVDSIGEAGEIDVAVIVVPPQLALSAIREAGETGVRNLVVITAGFGETGSEGASRERELREIAAEYDLNVVGPNSLGILSTATDLNATFGPDTPLDGSISFMSQSGAFVTAVIDWALEEGIGFADVVSLGNKAVLDESDFVRAWGSDERTEVVIGYLEGIDRGREFIDTAREVTGETPVVLVKSGRTDAGAQAASSHTGTIAGSDRAYEAGLDQAGVIRAETVQELFDAASALAGQPIPDGDGVAVVTNAGGPGVMATDAVGDSSLRMASFSEGTLDRYRETMPEEANVYNPVDVIGDADIDRFRAAIEIALEDGDVSAVAVLSAPTAVLSYPDLAEAIVELQAEYGTPIVTCLMGGERARAAKSVLADAGIPLYFDPARAIGSLDALVRYREISEREYDDPAEFDVDTERARELLQRATERDNRVGVEAMELLSAYGIPLPEGEVVSDPEEAERVARSIDGDVVLKIVSPDILHKSDIGGVAVGVADAEVRDTYEDLLTRARNYSPEATILGVQVQETIDLDSGVETLVGMSEDPQFGPLLAFGLGGIFVEIVEDVVFRVAPISEREAGEMVESIDALPLLRGARGREPVDERGIIETLCRLGQLVTDFPEIVELDINPLVATPDGVCAIDLQLTVEQ